MKPSDVFDAEKLAKYEEVLPSACEAYIRYNGDELLKDALTFIEEDGMYQPLMENFPLVLNDSIPPFIVKVMEQVGSPACANGNAVYLDTKVALTIALNAYAHSNANVMSLICDENNWNACLLDASLHSKLREALVTIICHEYTHILCNHTCLKKRTAKRGADDTYMDRLALACEIEANRGHLVSVGEHSVFGGQGGIVCDETFGDYTVNKLTFDGIMEGLKQYFVDNGITSQDKIPSELQQYIDKCKDDATIAQGMDVDKDSNNSVESKFGLDKANGSNAGDDPYDGMSVDQRLDLIKKRWTVKNVEKKLAKIRSELRGDLSTKRHRTYSRQSRRQNDTGILTKGVKLGRKASPRILIALDASGSMDSTKIETMAQSLEGVMNTVGRAKKHSHICIFDTDIRMSKPAKDWEQVVATYRSGGGTDFGTVYEFAKKMGKTVILSIGDGACSIKSSVEHIHDNVRNDFSIKWIDIIIQGGGYKYYLEDDIKAGYQREQLDLSDQLDKVRQLAGKIFH